MPIGPIGYKGSIGAICPNELMPIGPNGSIVQLAPDVLFMPIGPIGSTGPIGAICTNELILIGPIGSISRIGAICTIYDNWPNWFHGLNWCDISQ